MKKLLFICLLTGACVFPLSSAFAQNLQTCFNVGSQILHTRFVNQGDDIWTVNGYLDNKNISISGVFLIKGTLGILRIVLMPGVGRPVVWQIDLALDADPISGPGWFRWFSDTNSGTLPFTELLPSCPYAFVTEEPSVFEGDSRALGLAP